MVQLIAALLIAHLAHMLHVVMVHGTILFSDESCPSADKPGQFCLLTFGICIGVLNHFAIGNVRGHVPECLIDQGLRYFVRMLKIGYPITKMMVFDLTIPRAHNFLVDLHGEIRTLSTLIYVTVIFNDVLHKA